MIRVLPFLLVVALTVYALVDCIQTPDDKVRSLPKLAWIVLIVLIWLIGPLAWLIAGRERGRRLGRSGPAGPGRTGRAEPPPTLAPDDDPDFLRRLDREQRKKRPDDPEGTAPDRS